MKKKYFIGIIVLGLLTFLAFDYFGVISVIGLGNNNNLLSLAVLNYSQEEKVADSFLIINYSNFNSAYLGGIILSISGVTEPDGYPSKILVNGENVLTFNTYLKGGEEGEYLIDYPILISKKGEGVFNLSFFEEDSQFSGREISIKTILYRKSPVMSGGIYYEDSEAVVRVK